MNDDLLCLDTTIWAKILTDEEPQDEAEAARRLLARALRNARLVAPAWAWAELGSVLRKRVRMGFLRPDEIEALWVRFSRLPIDFIDTPELRARAWAIAAQFNLPTLYDATFLACTEVTPTSGAGTREFWTADRALIRQLGAAMPAYVRQLVP